MSVRRLYRPIALLTALAMSLSLLVVASMFTPAHAAEAVRDFALTKGHIDLFEVTYDEENQGLQLLVKDDTNLYESGAQYRNPEEVSIVVDAAGAQTDLSAAPPAYDFLKVDGPAIYLLPQTQDDDLPWPGWSTERLVASLPEGVTLPGGTTDMPVQLNVEIDGPGNVFTWQTGGFGAMINRYIDTVDPAADVIPITRSAHVHTNWAFTKPGDYIFTVTPTATTTDAQTLTGESVRYHFHIGDAGNLAAPQNTTPPEMTGAIRVGSTLTATPGVWAEDVDEFRYQWLRNGQAIADQTGQSYDLTQEDYAQQIAVQVTAIKSGLRAAVAHSEPAHVADENGELFAISGIQSQYQPGDTLQAQIIGHTLEEGQNYRWLARVPGSTLNMLFNGTGGQHEQGFFTQLLDASHDGIEISARLRQGTTNLAQTPWVPLKVMQEGNAPVLTRTLGDGPLYPGDRYRLEASELNLGTGEEFRFAFRYAVEWDATLNVFGTTATFPTETTVEVSRTGTNIIPVEVAAQVLRDGVVVRQSQPFVAQPTNFELPISGLQTLYLEGTAANLSAQIYPVRNSDAFIYQWQFSKVASFAASDPSTQTWGEGTTAAIEKNLNVADHDQGYLRIRVLTPDREQAFVTASVRIYVTDDPNAQLFLLNALAGHYHQGDAVNLTLTVSPQPQDGDQILWQWKWPEGDWQTLPGATGTQYSLTAEQALDGVEVRAILDFAAADKESVTAGPVTIYVDDHGSAARQKPTVTGPASVTAGDNVTFVRELPANGPTVLTDHRWERKAANSEQWTVIDAKTGADLSFVALAADNGAQYRVSLVKPNGQIAYGPSDAVTLTVNGIDPTPEPEPEPEPEPQPQPGPAVTSVTASAVRQVYGKAAQLRVSVSPRAQGLVSARIGTRTVTGVLNNGQVVLGVPALSLSPGKHIVAVNYAGVAGKFAPAKGQASISISKAVPKVTVKVGKKKVKSGKKAVITVRVRAAGVSVRGKVKVKVAGRTKVVKLNKKGRATVKIKLAKKTKAGRKKILVTYRGNAYVARSKGATTIRVIR